MIKVSVYYPNAAGVSFDMDYYVNTHMPLCQTQFGSVLKGMQVEQGLGGGAPGAPATYVAVGHLLFDSVEVFQAAAATAMGPIQADIPKYTNIQPTIQVSLIKL
jgi:uncharacterized protein (TIGR02118 family)